jgi:hypothetical protein
MTKKDPLDIDFGELGEAMEGLQNAFSEGLGAIDQADEEATKGTKPSHLIIINIKASAKIESHNYLVDAHLEFLADLNSILETKTGDVASLLGGLDVDLSKEESSQVVEQLGKPRCVGYLDKFKINKLELHSNKGKIKDGVNKEATMLITLEDKKLHLSFESVFALPKLQAAQTVYNVIPSQEKMQKNVVFDIDKLDKKTTFSWIEKDKDGLKIKGSAEIKKLEE